jgi:uncharacterized membrane protein YgcG
MVSRGRILQVVLSAALMSAVVTASASAAKFSGVVVYKNTRAHSFTVALRGGRLRAVHARRAPALGRVVNVTARLLRNGTWVAQHVAVGRVRRHVVVRGTVTFVNGRRHLFVLSARGVSILVREAGRHGAAGMAADRNVRDGEVVTVNGTLDGDAVDADGVQQSGEDHNGLDLEGTIQAIDTTARTLSISADDSDESGATLTVDVPSSFDMTAFSVGQSVELIVSPNPDGTYMLEQSSNDDGANNANNQGDDQGDDNGDHHDSAEQACIAEENDPNFAATHNGMPFGQFYNPQDPTNLDDALQNCINAKSQDGGDGGSDGSGGSDGGSGGSGGDGGSAGSGGDGGSDSSR